jgi:hypothetical protein
LRFNVYGKKLKRYFLIGLDLSIPFFRYHSGRKVTNESNVYITPAKYLRFDINAPIIIGMGFDIQKKKIALAIEPNVQLTNFIGHYPDGVLGRKVMISFGVNIMGLNTIPTFQQKQKGRSRNCNKKYGYYCDFLCAQLFCFFRAQAQTFLSIFYISFC